jgi:hypothetical protein
MTMVAAAYSLISQSRQPCTTVAARMKARVVEIDSKHLSLVSHPKEIAELILAAASHR